MPFLRLQFKGGVDIEISQTAAKGTWSQTNLIRWRSGFLEFMRGWQQICATALAGICREIHFWSDLVSRQWFACGTNSHLYIEHAGVLYDITPAAGFTPGSASSGSVPFSLLVWSCDNFGQDLIAVPSGQGVFLWVPPNTGTKAALIAPNETPAVLTGGLVGNAIGPWNAITAGGFSITINGSTVIVGALNFSAAAVEADVVAIVQAGLNAAVGAGVVTMSGTAPGGNWQFILTTISTGTSATLGNAFPPSSGTDISSMLGWTSALTAGLVQGAGGAGAPPYNQGAFVTMPEQIIMAFGSSPAPGTPAYPGPQDPMLVTWCDQSDYTDWAASTTNQAGSFRLSRGNRIVGGLQAPVGVLLWTDFDVWSVTYIGFPLVFGFFEVGSNCGLIAQKAATVLGSIPYWMSDHGFFRLTQAGAEQIPCSVWDAVYLNLDEANQDKCLAAANYHYSEVWFFYPSISGGSGEINSYVKYNIAENEWDYGLATAGQANAMARTAWTDQNRPGPPVAADLTGLLQEQDSGLTANGKPIEGIMAQSGYLDMAEGEEMVFADQWIPDGIWEGDDPSIQVSLYFRRWPGDPPSIQGPFTVTPSTEYITFRARGREVAEQITGTGNGWFRRGVPRLRIAPDGRYG